MADDKDKRIDDLLDANNRYLEEGRAARREVMRLNKLVRLCLGDGEVLLATEHQGRMRLMAELSVSAEVGLAMASYRVYRDDTMIYRHVQLLPAQTVYIDNVENMALEPV